MRLRLHHFVPITRAEGPGVRACLWVQGCPIACPGCFVPETWPEGGGRDVDTGDLAREILAGPQVEGITFLGGEPFRQAAALADLGSRLREAGLSVMTFTGYTLEVLERLELPSWRELLAVTDLLVDGPFRRDLPEARRPWVGSTNQRFHFLTERYRGLERQLQALPNRVEVVLGPDGSVRLNGMAGSQQIANLLRAGMMHQLPGES